MQLRDGARVAAAFLRWRSAACVLAALLASAAFAQAAERGTQPAQEKGWGSELANELMSPWCPGFALPDCTSGYAKQLHAWIIEQDKLGRPRAEVEAEVLARYGEKILQAPKAEGRAWFAYVIPAVALAAGAAIVGVFLLRQSAGAGATQSSPVNGAANDGAPDARLGARVDAELAAYESANPPA